MGNIQVGEEAYYCEDDGLGGFVIDRTNGDWDYTFRNFWGMDQNFNVLQETKIPLGDGNGIAQGCNCRGCA